MLFLVKALWCTVVTMGTVGYGDVYPISIPGRMIMLLGGIIGGLIVAGFTTTIFVDLAILSENEQRVVQIFEGQQIAVIEREAAAGVMQAAWRLRVALDLSLPSDLRRFGKTVRTRRVTIAIDKALGGVRFYYYINIESLLAVLFFFSPLHRHVTLTRRIHRAW